MENEKQPEKLEKKEQKLKKTVRRIYPDATPYTKSELRNSTFYYRMKTLTLANSFGRVLNIKRNELYSLPNANIVMMMKDLIKIRNKVHSMFIFEFSDLILKEEKDFYDYDITNKVFLFKDLKKEKNPKMKWKRQLQTFRYKGLYIWDFFDGVKITREIEKTPGYLQDKKKKQVNQSMHSFLMIKKLHPLDSFLGLFSICDASKLYHGKIRVRKENSFLKRNVNLPKMHEAALPRYKAALKQKKISKDMLC